MTFNTIRLSFEHSIARLMLDRPNRLNSLTESALSELHEALSRIEAQKDLRVLLLSGSGRAFCAGQDLHDPAMQVSEGQAPDIGSLVERLYSPLVMRLQNLKVPTVAAVNGLAAGGGVGLALSCDIVMASRSAYFLQAFSKIGLTPDTGNSWYLTRMLGSARALGLTMLAAKLSAAQAAEWGLIWRAVDDEKFDSEVEELLQRLAQMPTHALVSTRQLIRAATGHTLEQQLALEADVIRQMGRRSDYQEGVRAFEQKRAPCFTGD